jgi:short subunit dehydrogenase-like uncharacterized protein
MTTTDDWMIYGANGYTGELIARMAAARGSRPLLAGRNGEAIRALAGELGVAHRVFGLDDASAVDEGLSGVRAVLHCAGPFARTSRPMADAGLRRRVHYLDVTGEIPVFESLAARDGEAKAAGVMLLPGVGFDVVPSDCLAAHLKRRLPSATRLVLAFRPSGGVSRGTATTLVENLHRGGVVRRGGRLTPVPPGYRTRRFDFGRGPRAAVTIPWGDVSTAYHSTGIPDVEVYVAASAAVRAGLRLMRPFRRLLAARPVQSLLLKRVRSRPPGPTAEQRAASRCVLYGEASNGGRVATRMTTPDGYTLTALTALAAVEKVLAGEAPPGFQTPSRAYGPDFVLAIEGVSREDLDVPPSRPA